MRKWLPVVLIVGAFIASAVVYPRLPDSVPVHWGISGEPDRYGSRLEGAFLAPMIMLLIWGLMVVFPKVDPRRANISKFRESYDIIVLLTLLFMAGVHAVVLASALGATIDMNRVILLGVGVFFVVLGNLLPRARSNFFLGIRTPWTLSSDDVWTRSHRLAGYLFVSAGLVSMMSALIPQPWGLAAALAALLTAGIVPVIYSYLVWSREQKRGDAEG